MVFINQSDIIGVIIETSLDLTGSLFASILLMIIIIIALAFLFRIPLELTIVVILPLILVCMAYSSEFLMLGGVFTLYIAFIFAKKFFGF